MTDSERIMEVIRVKGLTNVQFCNATGVSAATLSHITSGRSNPTLSIMRCVIKGFPDINPMWVYSGEGEMFLPRENDAEATDTDGDASPTSINNSESGQAARSGATDSALPASSHSTARAQAARPVPDLFADFDGFASPGGLGSSRTAANASLSDVVRETLAQVQPQQRRVRQITEIRIFFDDGTYESFGGPK